MNHYEVTFIVDPVLSGDEIKATAQTYVDQLTSVGCTIVHVDEMGLRQLAYPIKKRSSGIYYCVEFSNENGEFLDNLELSLRRDERIMRFLTVRLDKYGVKYNEDKRNGLIGKRKKKEEPAKDEKASAKTAKKETPAPKKEKEEAPKAAKEETPAPEEAKEEAPAVEEVKEEAPAAEEVVEETPTPEVAEEEATPPVAEETTEETPEEPVEESKEEEPVAEADQKEEETKE